LEAPGELDENVERGEWNVKEKAGMPFNPESGQFGGNHNEVVVVHPNVVFFSGVINDPSGKLHVDALVYFPGCRVDIAARRQVMEKGPEDLVRKAIVVFLNLFLCEVDGLEGITCFSGALGKELVERGAPIGFF
jgi:hypothetical protein